MHRQRYGTPVYRHDRGDSYHAWVEFDRHEPVSSTLISTVGVATATEPVELSPLSSAVDPDAIERLVAHRNRADCNGSHTEVEFDYENSAISIRVDGEIVVTPPIGSE